MCYALVQWQTGEYKIGTCFEAGHSPPKGGVISHMPTGERRKSLRKRPIYYQLVGKVTAYQGDDGYRLLAESPAQWD